MRSVPKWKFEKLALSGSCFPKTYTLCLPRFLINKGRLRNVQICIMRQQNHRFAHQVLRRYFGRHVLCKVSIVL